MKSGFLPVGKWATVAMRPEEEPERLGALGPEIVRDGFGEGLGPRMDEHGMGRANSPLELQRLMAHEGLESVYSSASEMEPASVPEPEPAQEAVARRLKERVISVVMGNLFTFVVLGLLYLNYVLFESYIGVFLYSFLASEALWDTKVLFVRWLEYVNDGPQVSPRRGLDALGARARESARLHSGAWLLGLSALLVVVVKAPALALPAGALVSASVALLYALDRRLFVLTSMHRFVFNDDTLVALVLMLFVLLVGVVFFTLFAFFTVNDLRNMVHWLSLWVENKVLKAEWAQDLWQDMSQHGEETVESWLGDFESQYVTNTTYEPVFRWARRYVEESRAMAEAAQGKEHCMPWSVFDARCHAGEGAATSPGGATDAAVATWPWDWDSVFGLPDWMQNRTLSDIVQVLAAHSHSTDMSSITGKMQGVVRTASDGFWTTALFSASLLLIVIDFGVRVAFFFTITFILLSSQENLLHQVLTGLFDTQGHHPPNPWDYPQPPQQPQQPPQQPPQQQQQGDNSSGNGSGETGSRGEAASMEGAVGAQTPLATPSSAAQKEEQPEGGTAEAFTELAALEGQLRKTIEGVLMLPVKMSMWRAASTIVVYKLLGIELVFLAATMGILLTVFPLIYASWVCLPWCVVYALNGHYQISLALLGLHYGFYYKVDGWVLETFQQKTRKFGSDTPAADYSKNEFLTGVSVFFGVTAFGVHGVLLGPLLVCLGLVATNVLRDQQRAVQTDPAGMGGVGGAHDSFRVTTPVRRMSSRMPSTDSREAPDTAARARLRQQPQQPDSPRGRARSPTPDFRESAAPSPILGASNERSRKRLRKSHSSATAGQQPPHSPTNAEGGNLYGNIFDTFIGAAANAAASSSSAANTSMHSNPPTHRRRRSSHGEAPDFLRRPRRGNGAKASSSCREKLQEAKSLLDEGLIDQEHYDAFAHAVLSEISAGASASD